MIKQALGICGLVVLMVWPADGGQALSVTVTPLKSFAPASVRVITRITPDAENRSLALIADGENFYRSSEIPLEGDHAPRLFDLLLPNLPGGEYRIVAVLTDTAGRERAVANQFVTVLGGDAR